MTDNFICLDCGSSLTETEQYYYERRCESCEADWLDSIESWRNGGENEEFDALFSVKRDVH